MSGESGTVHSWVEHEAHYFFRSVDPTISSSLKRKMPVNSDDNDVVNLRQHGYDARVGANEACLVAVDYAFE
ncbi:hypothetical protein HHX47_DHR6000733 [Lentinula edodes]|nr:hypothetical protein HHX47_DHR6000733 [Lentinula edodes]